MKRKIKNKTYKVFGHEKGEKIPDRHIGNVSGNNIEQAQRNAKKFYGRDYSITKIKMNKD